MHNHITSLYSFVESMRSRDVLDDDVLALSCPLRVNSDPFIGLGLRADCALNIPPCSEECKGDVGADKPTVKEDV